MIITDEIKQHCENTIGTKDPDKIHHHKTGFYIGYALGASEVESLKAQKEIDRQEIERLKKALHRSLVLLGVYKPEKFKNTMLENEYDTIKSEGTELLKGYRS
jgi:hypothetical protein